ncbi:MAG: aminotransferase class I/II-fold pyridoxal phosphate-dependent enzyme [Chitinophagales bacterium]|nr:aminotransferase class I/II-fold pyridoxal phosphate-dependent enzyme [Chitinophagales bacterium]
MKTKNLINNTGFESTAIKDSGLGSTAHLPPIFATSTFVYESPEEIMKVFKNEKEAYIYTRWDNPTVNFVEEKIAALATLNSDIKGKTLLFASGMAAISSLIDTVVHPGDTVLAQSNIYGGSVELFDLLMKEKGVKVEYLDMHDLETLENRTQTASLIYIESPSNPTINAYDIQQICSIAHQSNCKVAIDNTLSTPYLQRPLQLGVDFELHSTTKYLNGHGTALGGAMVTTDNNFYEKCWNYRKLHGGVCSPFDAWLLNNGLKTLAIRMEKHCDNSELIVEFLNKRKEVTQVNYLSLKDKKDHKIAEKQMYRYGGVLSFELKGGIRAGIDLMKNIRFCTLTSTLGTPDTLINHPASMTHVKVNEEQKLRFGITDGLIRMSVGLEDVNDIIADLGQALDSIS